MIVSLSKSQDKLKAIKKRNGRVWHFPVRNFLVFGSNLAMLIDINHYAQIRGFHVLASTKTFHSFRHTIIDNLRGRKLESGEFIREEDIALVVGHTQDKRQTQTADYGQDRAQLELRHAVIEAITYEGVEFGSIRPRF